MNRYIWGNEQTQFFYQLDPETILSSVESIGLIPTGRCFALNSMENRVYEIQIESESTVATEHFVIAKFYRPGRWTQEQILEEHEFLKDLKEAEVPVIAPIEINGSTLFEVPNQKLLFCVFPKQGGRAPQDMNEEVLQIMGRLLARIHSVGATKKAPHRIQISPDTFGIQNLEYLLQSKSIPHPYEHEYSKVVREICEISAPLFANIRNQRIHGDCHLGNIISRENIGIYFIDFDDMLMGPAIQDIWLVVPGGDDQAKQDRLILVEAYESMNDFDRTTLKLVEPLRSLRLIHFAAWISKRWEDPAFKQAFPFFGNDQYWATQTSDLQQQLQKIQDELSYQPYNADFDRWS